MNNVWKTEEGEIRKPGIQHLVVTALLIGVGAVAGMTGASFSVGFGISFFWPGIAIQVVGGIWYGIWGTIAAGIFPIISNLVSGTPPVVSMLWIPANAFQGFLTGFVFRKLNLDPRLRNFRDYFFFILIGGILTSIPGAFYAPAVGRLFGLFTKQSYYVAVGAWAIGNAVAAITFGIILLKALSPIVIKTKAFCKGLLA
jgi:hypothetical protein